MSRKRRMKNATCQYCGGTKVKTIYTNLPDGSVKITEKRCHYCTTATSDDKMPRDGELACEECNHKAHIKVHGHLFCMEHYNAYYYAQPKACLPWEVLIDEIQSSASRK